MQVQRAPEAVKTVLADVQSSWKMLVWDARTGRGCPSASSIPWWRVHSEGVGCKGLGDVLRVVASGRWSRHSSVGHVGKSLGTRHRQSVLGG